MVRAKANMIYINARSIYASNPSRTDNNYARLLDLDVEELSDHPRAKIRGKEVISHDNTAAINEDGHRYRSLIHEVPLIHALVALIALRLTKRN